MTKADLQKGVDFLLADTYMHSYESERYVDWAVNLLSNGYESENLYILAGLDKEPKEVVDEYFKLVLQELDIDVVTDSDAIINKYAIHIAKDTLAGAITLDEGFGIMLKLADVSGYDSKYAQFDYLLEDINCSPDYSVFNDGLTNENKEQFMKREFELFLESEALELTSGERQYWYCRNCGYVGEPRQKPDAKQPYTWGCAKCDANSLAHYANQDVKAKILDYIRKNER